MYIDMDSINLSAYLAGMTGVLHTINIKSHVEYLFCVYIYNIFVAERHSDIYKIIWMSDYLQNTETHSNDIATVRVSFCKECICELEQVPGGARILPAGTIS